ncbi:HD domain-containing protein [Candidatus Bathyarchaeota archaeon]|nr:HD domain-containing protein [Candidatus Bathyarchaeota archaeon]
MDYVDWSNTSIYDEVYGYIPLTNIELSIINHPVFQRLNHIRQLGNTFRVFPGAQHTRFSHSLGVMYIIDKMISSREINLESKDDRQKLRLAGLLHDIGHYPFSHAIETLYSNGKNVEGRHEKFGSFILNNYSIKDILSVNGYNPEEISRIFLATHDNPLFNQLMSSDLDADRIDYLLRDSFHTGVKYGRFDLDRILHTLTVSNEGLLGIDEEGIQAVDGYIIGRHLMWTTVYTHKTIAGYDELLKTAFRLTTDLDYANLQSLKKLSEEDLIKFNDSYVLSKIADNMASPDPYVSEICKTYFKRDTDNHLHIAKEYKEFTKESQTSKIAFQLDMYKNENNLERLMKKDYLKGWIFHSNSRTKLPSLKPNIIDLKQEDANSTGEMVKTLYIINDQKESIQYPKYKHSLVKHLIDLSFDVVRIFTKKAYTEEVKDIIEKDIEENYQ